MLCGGSRSREQMMDGNRHADTFELPDDLPATMGCRVGDKPMRDISIAKEFDCIECPWNEFFLNVNDPIEVNQESSWSYRK
jgi:hypothetical protein